MTSSEPKSSGNATPQTLPKKTVGESVSRKASFKCSTPNRSTWQKTTARKVVLPISTVQALTFKFNELSRVNEGQKHRVSQMTVKNILASGSHKSSTIKVVICRKPSTLKHKRFEEVLIRKKINVRRLDSSRPTIREKDGNFIRSTVNEKIVEFDKREKTEKRCDSEVNKVNGGKAQVSKILVDIDLTEKNNSIEPEQSKMDSEKTREEKVFSVRNAINLFEKNSKSDGDLLSKQPSWKKSREPSKPAAATAEIKEKPIAAIKPILKKPEEKSLKKTKLLPKDSLNRKRYILMKREFSKANRNQNGSEENEKIYSNGNDSEESGHQSMEESEKKVKNDSVLQERIQNSSLSVMATEIPLRDNDETFQVKIHSETVCSNLKPNTSFLWSKKDDSYGERRQANRMDLPLPNPPENYIPNVEDKADEGLYDDVLPKNHDSDSEEFEKLNGTDESDTYDDIDVYKNGIGFGRKKNSEEDAANGNVRLKNEFNKMTSYLYDDGEGEKYQYISEKAGIDSRRSTDSTDVELYQYIQNNKEDTGNIYEDIQSVKCQITNVPVTPIAGTKERNDQMVKDIYEDVNSTDYLKTSKSNNNETNNVNDNGELFNNCYESVYNGIYGDSNGNQGYIKSDLSDGSNNSGRSSTYEKNNSLYGISGENTIISDGISSLGDGSDQRDNLEYHVTLFGSACPISESSQSNSDDWIEVSESDSTETIYLVQEKLRKTKAVFNSVTQKEKKRWKKLQRKTKHNLDESKLQNSDDHFYESVGQYENVEVIQEAARILKAEEANNISQDSFYSEEQFIDDFDSQSSGDEAYTDAKLPDVPNHGYNITKSLKAAGKKLRKNFSLRKSDLSKSLKRFKKSSRAKLTDADLGVCKDVEVDSLQKPESPSSPTYVCNSMCSNNSDSSNGSQKVVKINGTNDLKNQRHRKSWTFRNKFKSNTAETNVPATYDSNRNSTFYLSLNELRSNKNEGKKDELLNEIQSVLLKRSGNSVENLIRKEEIGWPSSESDSATTNVSTATSGANTKFRPSVPPPPPPPPPPHPPNKMEVMSSEKTKYSDILWGEKGSNKCLYIESGLFDKQKKHSRCTESDGSLYAEIGLYAATDEITSKKTQMFVDEPLYQFYTECVNQRARDDILNNYDSEGYEEINDYYSVINEKRRTIDIKNVRPNFDDFNEDMRSSKITPLKSITDRRTLWCQIPLVVDSCILESLSDQARKLQEAKFEIITSEGSYMNSLNVLENHFMKKVSDLNIITKRDFRILFSNILSVKKCSENFLKDLENCWQNNIMLNGICDIVYKHSTSSFQVYTKYCKNQVCIYRTLRELLDKNWNFENALKEIESDPICQNLNIHSFLMLPMQRITRLPLLMGAVLARMDKNDDEFDVCKASFDVLNKIVQDCDDEARRMEKCEEMLILSQQIEFPKDIRRIPIITGSRFLVKSGQVTQLVNRDENKLTFGKKFSKVTLTLFLFTDLLILAKKKNPRNYVVVDHCPRNLVQMQTTEGLTQLPVKLNSNSDASGKLLMLLTMLENHEKKTVEMILSFEMESDRQRWLEAVTPKSSENPNECIYEEWDCPQVIALYEFTPVQPDELNLCIGDVVNVLKKMSDGWYQGERLRDGARGWFPQNHTQEVSSSHIRAKNKKLRYKLLALSGNLIDSQKTNGK